MKPTILLSMMFSSVLIFSGCVDKSSEPGKSAEIQQISISYGNDHCAFTKEKIETVRYGGEIVMKDGTSFKFMSVECVAGFYLNLENKSDIQSMKIVDFAHGKQLLPVDQLIYLKSKLRPSPNGMFLTAVDASNEKMKSYIYDAYPGPYLEWEEVLEMVREEWDLS